MQKVYESCRDSSCRVTVKLKPDVRKDNFVSNNNQPLNPTYFFTALKKKPRNKILVWISAHRLTAGFCAAIASLFMI